MKKLGDLECISSTQPKKYHSTNLKIVLMFNLTDPYKLVSDQTKYKIDELTSSYCYLSMEEAVNLRQTYYITGQKEAEGYYINKTQYGLHQFWTPSGNKWYSLHYNNNMLNGLFQEWYQTGQKKKEGMYVDNNRTGLWLTWNEAGDVKKETMY
jgi:antitoxin component YwqK of YwqJK toxin-antitoxin module